MRGTTVPTQQPKEEREEESESVRGEGSAPSGQIRREFDRMRAAVQSSAEPETDVPALTMEIGLRGWGSESEERAKKERRKSEAKKKGKGVVGGLFNVYQLCVVLDS